MANIITVVTNTILMYVCLWPPGWKKLCGENIDGAIGRGDCKLAKHGKGHKPGALDMIYNQSNINHQHNHDQYHHEKGHKPGAMVLIYIADHDYDENDHDH